MLDGGAHAEGEGGGLDGSRLLAEAGGGARRAAGVAAPAPLARPAAPSSGDAAPAAANPLEALGAEFRHAFGGGTPLLAPLPALARGAAAAARRMAANGQRLAASDAGPSLLPPLAAGLARLPLLLPPRWLPPSDADASAAEGASAATSPAPAPAPPARPLSAAAAAIFSAWASESGSLAFDGTVAETALWCLGAPSLHPFARPPLTLGVVDVGASALAAATAGASGGGAGSSTDGIALLPIWRPRRLLMGGAATAAAAAAAATGAAAAVAPPQSAQPDGAPLEGAPPRSQAFALYDGPGAALFLETASARLRLR
jgi:hypothetical protein